MRARLSLRQICRTGLAVGALVALVTIAATAGAQEATGRTRSILVEVADNADSSVISGSDVSLTIEGGQLIAHGVTGADGRTTLTVPAVTGTTSIVVRKVGYAAVQGAIAAAVGDTAVRVMLSRQAQLLDGTVTNARAFSKEYSIGADEIAHTNRGLFNALIVLEKLRPEMLGDANRLCGATDKIWINGLRVMFGPLSAPPPAAHRADLAAPPPMTADPSRAPAPHSAADDFDPRMEILSTIKAEHIEEMRYLNCWARPPGNLRNDALYITLKPGIAWDWKHGSYAVDSVGVPRR